MAMSTRGGAFSTVCRREGSDPASMNTACCPPPRKVQPNVKSIPGAASALNACSLSCFAEQDWTRAEKAASLLCSKLCRELPSPVRWPLSRAAPRSGVPTLSYAHHTNNHRLHVSTYWEPSILHSLPPVTLTITPRNRYNCYPHLHVQLGLSKATEVEELGSELRPDTRVSYFTRLPPATWDVGEGSDRASRLSIFPGLNSALLDVY